MTAQSIHISQTLIDQCQMIAEGIIAKQYARQSELWQHVGPTGRNLSVRDAGYHLSYLAEALLNRLNKPVSKVRRAKKLRMRAVHRQKDYCRTWGPDLG